MKPKLQLEIIDAGTTKDVKVTITGLKKTRTTKIEPVDPLIKVYGKALEVFTIELNSGIYIILALPGNPLPFLTNLYQEFPHEPNQNALANAVDLLVYGKSNFNNLIVRQGESMEYYISKAHKQSRSLQEELLMYESTNSTNTKKDSTNELL